MVGREPLPGVPGGVSETLQPPVPGGVGGGREGGAGGGRSKEGRRERTVRCGVVDRELPKTADTPHITPSL